MLQMVFKGQILQHRIKNLWSLPKLITINNFDKLQNKDFGKSPLGNHEFSPDEVHNSWLECGNEPHTNQVVNWSSWEVKLK
jgi:hypothetical protein